ncbi:MULTISPECIES: FtsW/RodA/SpoVE family cell cycle protein [Myroides]|uniref:Probable peptidoglycan glycosyltransferase FtsW n=1 Tax=Myroides albus TaxID=2562892 RepID=A0A6I3LNA1_9FLAO|nr:MULTISPECIES: FtsW/RodA/SpoVE family cell cycle protein [Myroides]MTG98071.1 cell division protein FtsW [Myroides albus]MVX36291.1 cell division protein FtsW [Myroides sp. LoEW2-1]UVD80749.1 FtsW/RodA/SpoVE family cell cycle protein [Myroides albus]
MKWLYAHLYGDKTIWALVILLACFSIMPVYSASTNLVYTVGTGEKTIYYLIKHFVHISVGLIFMWLVHRVDYRYFKLVGFVGIPVVVLLLIYTLTKGTMIGGANASRWVSVLGVQFQPSSIAAIVLTVYVAQYLVKIKDKTVDFVSSLWELWLPVGLIVLLILPANFSTAAIISLVVFTVALIGKYPLKYLAIICSAAVLFIGIFMITAKAFPGLFPNRVDTWISRIDRFANSDDSTKDLYQVQNAKIAIASGGLFGLGPGKSVQKNFLPQSSSDFIYAIIVEEYGVVFGVFLLFVYMSLFFRFLIAIHRAPTVFGQLLVVGLGFFLIYQTLINIGVAVSFLPTTGQPLPLISSGGTSIWMTCVALGIILSVTKSEREIQEREMEKSDAEKREEEELNRIQLEKEQILEQELKEN